MTTTPNINLELPTFDETTWHDKVNGNFTIIDAAILTLLGLQVSGIWLNSTLYTVGTRVIDANLGTMWQCAVENTSPSTGTFAAYRAANPTHWTLVGGAIPDPTVREVSAAGVITQLSTDDVILVNKTVGAATTVNLLTSAGRVRPLKIVDLKGDAATNNITINRAGVETIIGATSYIINQNNGSVDLWPRPDGLGWYI